MQRYGWQQNRALNYVAKALNIVAIAGFLQQKPVSHLDQKDIMWLL